MDERRRNATRDVAHLHPRPAIPKPMRARARDEVEPDARAPVLVLLHARLDAQLVAPRLEREDAREHAAFRSAGRRRRQGCLALVGRHPCKDPWVCAVSVGDFEGDEHPATKGGRTKDDRLAERRERDAHCLSYFQLISLFCATDLRFLRTISPNPALK